MDRAVSLRKAKNRLQTRGSCLYRTLQRSLDMLHENLVRKKYGTRSRKCFACLEATLGVESCKAFSC